MGRPREFDEDEAVERAMTVFWEKGYEATSLPDLLTGMGLSRGSFYKAFKNKRAIYLAALRRYERTAVASAIVMLKPDGVSSGPEKIARLFFSVVKSLRTPQARRGCFLCKAAVDRAPHDKDVERTVVDIMGRIELAFGEAISHGRGGRRTESSLRKAGGPFAAIYIGIEVLRNAGVSAATIENIVNRTLDGLPGN